MRHLLWEIAEGEGYEKLKVAAHKGLKGLKVAPFYGCQILRPSKIMRLRGSRPAVVARADHRGVRRRGDRLSGEDQVLRLPDHPGARGDRARRADPAGRAGDGGRRRRDGDAVPALPPLARRVAAEARGGDGPEVRHADPPPLAARRRRRRARGVRAEVQAAHRRSAARAREAPRSEDAGSCGRAGRPVRCSRGARRRAAGLGWGWFEAGWVRLRELEVELPGLPRRARRRCGSRTSPTSISACRRAGARAVERAVEWVAERRPDLVCDHRRPADASARRAAAARARRTPAAAGASPCSATTTSRSRATRRRAPSNLRELEPATPAARRGRDARAARPRVWIAGVDPRLIVAAAEDRPERALAATPTCGSCSATSRACSTGLEPGAFDLVLAGHMHDGQITRAVPGRQAAARASDARATRAASTGTRGGVMHVSPGLGTTFVPFRFAARPEATELVLRSA